MGKKKKTGIIAQVRRPVLVLLVIFILLEGTFLFAYIFNRYIEMRNRSAWELADYTASVMQEYSSIGWLAAYYIYDFPIGKWGPYGAFSYFLAPVYGAAFFMFLAILCHCLKRILPVKRFLVYLGDNSMDYLMIHFFIIFLTSYIGGFWYNFLHDPAPDFNRKFRFFHFLILLGAVFAVCHTVIAGKKHIRNLMEKK